MNRSSLLRVALVDRHDLFADCLGVVLEMRQWEFRKVPIATDSVRTEHVLAALTTARPAVAVINADLGPLCSATALIEPLSRAGVAVVVIADRVDEAHDGYCLSLGARTVVSKSASLVTIVSVIRRLGLGQRVLDTAERERLIRLHRQRCSSRREVLTRLNRLSTQEGRILGHLMAGRTVREIAAIRVVSEATVRTQVKSILHKLEVSSQLSAVALAHAAGWSMHPLPAAG